MCPGPCDHLDVGSPLEPMQVGVSWGSPSLLGVSSPRRSLCSPQSMITAPQPEQVMRHSAILTNRETEALVVSPARSG